MLSHYYGILEIPSEIASRNLISSVNARNFQRKFPSEISSRNFQRKLTPLTFEYNMKIFDTIHKILKYKIV